MEPALRTRLGLRLPIAVAVAGLVAACVGAAPAERTPRERAVNFAVEGVVGAVDDGDTLTVVAANDVRFVVRLSDIDAPELFHRGGPDRACPGRLLADRPGQPQGRAAREALATLALGKPARAECYEIDRFGRPVCHVFVGAVNVNLAQIAQGWGMLQDRVDWVRDPASHPAQEEARARRAGVWSSPAPIHPATWREQCWGRGECPAAES